ncbi:MAG: ChaN family lipoprotein [Desulfobacteraceae bacterium]|nr:ChaN family lipoprotein [Desulfobacteraceae bacterium]
MLMLALAPAAAAAPAPDYHLTAGFDLAQATIKAVAEITIPGGQGLSLDLGDLTTTAIELNGQPLARPLGDQPLAIAPQEGERHLVIDYQKSFAKAPDNLISPQGIALTGLWHPRPDHDCRFHLKVSLPKGFTAVSEADRIDTEPTPAGVTVRFAIHQDLPAINLAAGPYVVTEDHFGNGQTLYTYFFPEDAALASAYREKALAYLKRYQELIGPYPYQRFSVVENRLPTGYAMPGFTLLGQAVVRLPFITDTSLGHEILHSWFGNAIRVDQSQGNWCEGLTTYLADQAFAVDRGEGREFRREELLKYQDYVRADSAMAVKDFHGAEPGQEVAVQAERAVGYGKAAMIFRMLEAAIGHQRFVAGLRRLYQTKNGKLASWADLEACFEPGGKSLAPFFSQWLTRRDLPQLSAEKITLAEKDGLLTLTFTLHQATKTPYALQVPIALVASTGSERRLVTVNQTDERVSIPLTHAPATLVIDPDYDLMRTLSPGEVPASWDWVRGADKPLVVVNSPEDYDLYLPLIKGLETGGAKVVAADEVTDPELAAQALIFLGVSGAVPRSLFANPSYPKNGLTVDIRKNPLDPSRPAALLSASSQAELMAGLAKLDHYGKYGYLHFEGGSIKDKAVRKAGFGMTYPLEDEPTAVATQSGLNFAEVMARLAEKRVIYVGESHPRYADHQLQLRVIRELASHGKPLAIGMEMFPHGSQKAIDDFLAKRLDEKEFLRKSKYFDVWRFDWRLYRDILAFARAQDIPVVALNTDRKNVSQVFAKGGAIETGPEIRSRLPVDRDLDLPDYRERIHEVYVMHPGRKENGFSGFFQSQSIWDEVMAQTIANYLTQHPERQMVILAGNGHVDKQNAIPPRVSRRLPVEQAVVMDSDGTPIYPEEADYLFFMPPAELPPPALMGVVMGMSKGHQDKVAVDEVMPHSPAAKAGIRKGDLMLTIDGQAVTDPEEARILLIDKKPGDRIKVKVDRPALFGEHGLELELTL